MITYTYLRINVSLNSFLYLVFKPSPTVGKITSPLRYSKKPAFSASDKAARYFVDLQHSRKHFWEMYRHILLPMIRTQIQNSARTRRTRTDTSIKFRQAKRNENLDSLKSSVANNPEAKKQLGEKTSFLRKYKGGLRTPMMYYLAYSILGKCIYMCLTYHCKIYDINTELENIEYSLRNNQC